MSLFSRLAHLKGPSTLRSSHEWGNKEKPQKDLLAPWARCCRFLVALTCNRWLLCVSSTHFDLETRHGQKNKCQSFTMGSSTRKICLFAFENEWVSNGLVNDCFCFSAQFLFANFPSSGSPFSIKWRIRTRECSAGAAHRPSTVMLGVTIEMIVRPHALEST